VNVSRKWYPVLGAIVMMFASYSVTIPIASAKATHHRHHASNSRHPHKHKRKRHHQKQKPKSAPKPEAPVVPPSTTTPTPPAEQPKAEPEAPYAKMETIGEMELNEERPACTYIESPHGDPVTVHFDAEFGTFANEGMGSPMSGNRWCAPYTAPTNLPEAFLAPGLSVDFIEVVVQDTVTGKFGFAFGIVELVPRTNF
jgi:hypothetical protein